MPDLTSLLLAGARWLTYFSVLLIIGGAGARVVLARASAATAVDVVKSILVKRIERTARLGAWLWCVAVACTLAIQLVAWFGADGLLNAENVGVMITGTVWGQGWQWTAVGSCFVVALFVAAQIAPALSPLAMFGGAVTAAVASPLVGHGGSHGNTVWMLHAAHVLGAGLWIGTLGVLLRTIGVRPHADVLRPLLLSLSSVALTGASIAVATGGILALDHIPSFSALLETAFGITLLVKIFVVLDLVALGYLNWKVFGPRVAADDGRARLVSVAITETALGLLLVLAITAWLSGLPIPGAG